MWRKHRTWKHRKYRIIEYMKPLWLDDYLHYVSLSASFSVYGTEIAQISLSLCICSSFSTCLSLSLSFPLSVCLNSSQMNVIGAAKLWCKNNWHIKRDCSSSVGMCVFMCLTDIAPLSVCLCPWCWNCTEGGARTEVASLFLSHSPTCGSDCITSADKEFIHRCLFAFVFFLFCFVCVRAGVCVCVFANLCVCVCVGLCEAQMLGASAWASHGAWASHAVKFDDEAPVSVLFDPIVLCRAAAWRTVISLLVFGLPSDCSSSPCVFLGEGISQGWGRGCSSDLALICLEEVFYRGDLNWDRERV